MAGVLWRLPTWPTNWTSTGDTRSVSYWRSRENVFRFWRRVLVLTVLFFINSMILSCTDTKITYFDNYGCEEAQVYHDGTLVIDSVVYRNCR